MVRFGVCRGWARYAAAAGLVLGLASACADEPETEDGSATTGDNGEATVDDGETTSDNGETTGGDSTETIAWVPFGPADPTIPTPAWPMYRRLAQGDCSGLDAYLADEGRSVGEFGTALVAVCRAAVEGQHDQWEVATTHRQADASTVANHCLAPVMKTLLDRALDWHERNPGRSPKVVFFEEAGTTKCARAESGPETTDSSETTDSPDTTDPDTTDPDTTDNPDTTDDDGGDAPVSTD